MFISAREERSWPEPITPKVSAGCIVENSDRDKIVIIDRKFEPLGLAYPAGHQEIGETIEECGIRETEEEVGIRVKPIGLLNICSSLKADPRWQVVIAHIVAQAPEGAEPVASDDAADAFWMDYLDDSLLDHFLQSAKETLMDYRNWRKTGGNLAILR